MKKLLLLYVYEDGKDIVEDDDNELYIRFYSTAVMCHIKTFKGTLWSMTRTSFVQTQSRKAQQWKSL
jgi:hypothetical protein